MTLNVALTVAKGVGWNTLVGTGHLAAGFAVATAIHKIAYAILKIEKDSPHLCSIEFVAMMAGATVSLYFAPQIALASFTANQVLKLIALHAVLEIPSNFMFKDHESNNHVHLIFRPITCGAVIGYFGAPALVALGTAGALRGVERATDEILESSETDETSETSEEELDLNVTG